MECNDAVCPRQATRSYSCLRSGVRCEGRHQIDHPSSDVPSSNRISIRYWKNIQRRSKVRKTNVTEEIRIPDTYELMPVMFRMGTESCAKLSHLGPSKAYISPISLSVETCQVMWGKRRGQDRRVQSVTGVTINILRGRMFLSRGHGPRSRARHLILDGSGPPCRVP